MRKIINFFIVISFTLATVTIVAKKCAWWDLPCNIKEAANITQKAVAPGIDKALHDTKNFFNQLGDNINNLSNKSQKALITATQVLKDQSEKSGDWINTEILKAKKTEKSIVSKLKTDVQTVEELSVAFAHIAQKMITNWFAAKIKPIYCKIPPSVHEIEKPMLLDNQKDDGLKQYIKKYAPVLYLHHDELRYPIWISEYVAGPNTALNCGTENYDPCAPGERNPIVPKGQVTMQKIYQYYKDYKAGKRPYNLYFDIDECVTFGSNPALNKDGSGNLNTPVYVATYTDEQHNKIYIQYLFTFGFNEPYNIGPFTGDTADFQDGHEFDLEHFTVELDAKTKNVVRYYYSSHGTREGFWMSPNDPHIKYENGHPVAYIARGSHAVYPREGIYVRIFGVANDVTAKDVRWIPRLMRVFDESDPRFDPSSMGWIYHPGTMGRRGVAPASKQGWFMNPQGRTDPKTGAFIPGGDIGRGYPESQAPYCGREINEGLTVACIAAQIPHAKPPL